MLVSLLTLKQTSNAFSFTGGPEENTTWDVLDHCPKTSVVTFDTVQVFPTSIICTHLEEQQGNSSQRVG